MPVDLNQEHGIATLTLNRPKAYNAMSPELLGELEEVFDRVEADSGVRCAILTGEGEKAFCAGADVDEMTGMTPLEARDFALRGQRLTRRMEQSDTPIIAAVNGFAFGGGCELALACDFRVAAESAVLGQPEVNLGILPGWGGTQRLTRLVSPGRAKEMILSGNSVTASEALDIGLVNHVYPLDQLGERTRELANSIASGPTWAVSSAKRLCNLALEADIDSGLQREADVFGLAFTTPDQREGMTAFVEKREANFAR